jgi:hypothetical protein
MDSAMPTQDDPVQVYLELSNLYDRRREPPMRDRFLVLAADAALRIGRTAEADRLRLRLLKFNPHHMLKPYASFTQATQAPDVQTYIRDLRLNYPTEVAVVLLHSLRNATTLNETRAPTPSLTADDHDATVTLDEPAEPFKVFAEEHEPDVAQTAALPPEFAELARRAAASQTQPRTPVPAPRPAPPRSAPQRMAAPKKPAPAAHLVPFAAPAPSLDPTAEEPDGLELSGWFAAGLSVLVLAVGLIIIGYVLVRPFLS